MHRNLTRLAASVALALVTTVAGASAAAADPGVDPTTVDDSLAPGESQSYTKTVHTSEIPPKPDVVFLADTTGSMGAAINNVKTNVQSVINQIRASQPEAQFGVAQYKDREHGCAFDPFDVHIDHPVTNDDTAVQSAVNTWTASGGCDAPENQLLALHALATDPAVGFRSDSSRVIAWFGDVWGHEDDPSLAETIAALQAADIRVIAVSVGAGALDNTGQATAITNATGGVLLTTGSDVASAILSGLGEVEVKVSPSPTCDTGLSLAFDPPSRTVTSGDAASFVETVTVAPDAPQGTTLSCTTDFLIDGNSAGPAFVQTLSIYVEDVTAPSAACSPSTNPGGRIPTAGSNPRSGMNPDGFYVLQATDNVDASPSTYLVDTGSGTVFGPYPDGTRIKYTQSNAAPSAKSMGGAGGVDYHINGTGDAAMYATDASGNTSASSACLVPAPPK